jgi:hypothetical protein
MQTLMNLERLFFGCIVVAAGTFVATNSLADTQIFKTVDANGNVIFTDVPPRAEQTAEKVDLQTPNSFADPEANPETNSARQLWIVDPDANEDDERATPTAYLSLSIGTPTDQSTVRENAGDVTVVASLEPSLHPGHSLRLLLDGLPAASTSNPDAVFTLSNIDRGTHHLQAEVMNQTGTVIFSGPSSVFHLQRYSKLTAPNRPRPSPQGGN